MGYKAEIFNPKNGREKVESVVFETRGEAVKAGEDGVEFYGGSHYEIVEEE